MLAIIGMKGSITTRDKEVSAVMGALYELDDGEFKADKVFKRCE